MNIPNYVGILKKDFFIQNGYIYTLIVEPPFKDPDEDFFISYVFLFQHKGVKDKGQLINDANLIWSAKPSAIPTEIVLNSFFSCKMESLKKSLSIDDKKRIISECFNLDERYNAQTAGNHSGRKKSYSQ